MPRRLSRCLYCILLIFCSPAYAADIETIRTKSPDLFHPETGLRIDRQRGPTPDDIAAPSKVISATEAKRLLEQGAIALDVFGAAQSSYDALDGTWLVKDARLSLPGAIWLPEVGRGSLTKEMDAYLVDNIRELTSEDLSHPLIIFCVADCWMSWNASQRVAGLGYTNVNWFRLGTDGWLDEGWALEPVAPVPVHVN